MCTFLSTLHLQYRQFVFYVDLVLRILEIPIKVLKVNFLQNFGVNSTLNPSVHVSSPVLIHDVSKGADNFHIDLGDVVHHNLSIFRLSEGWGCQSHQCQLRILGIFSVVRKGCIQCEDGWWYWYPLFATDDAIAVGAEASYVLTCAQTFTSCGLCVTIAAPTMGNIHFDQVLVPDDTVHKGTSKQHKSDEKSTYFTNARFSINIWFFNWYTTPSILPKIQRGDF